MSLIRTVKTTIYVVLIAVLCGCKASPTNEEQNRTLGNLSSGVVASEVTLSSSDDDPVDNAEPQSNVKTAVTSTAEPSTTTVSEFPVYGVDVGQFNLYPREITGWDESGWSKLSPSNDSRLIYVSSISGDDASAEFYVPSDVEKLKDPGTIKPFKTIHAALEHARDGYPDWVLLKMDESWEVSKIIQLPRGRGITERMVITSYGAGSQRPIIKSDASEALRIWSNRNYIAIVGLSVSAYKRDPVGSDFIGWAATDEAIGLRVYGPQGISMGSVLVEGNDFNYFSYGMSINGGGDIVDLVIRRNTIRNSYSQKSHSQGIYATHASVLLEENVFYHNGWYKQQDGAGNDKSEGQATIFNHNTYFSKSEFTKFKKNIFIGASSIHNKWTADSRSEEGFDTVQARNIEIDSNIYIGGEIGISAGGNTDYDTGYRWQNMTISNNIMFSIGQDQPTNRKLGWYIDASDWNGGLICGNYLLHNNNTNVTNIKGIQLSGHSADVLVNNNFIIGLVNSGTPLNEAAILLTADEFSNIRVEDNVIQLTNSDLRPLRTNSLLGVSFAGNRYFSEASDDSWFRVGSINYSFEDWESVSGELGATNVEAVVSNPLRSIETYAGSLGLTIEEFEIGLISQSGALWSREYTVDAIVEYIEDGYGSNTCD